MRRCLVCDSVIVRESPKALYCSVTCYHTAKKRRYRKKKLNSKRV